MTKTPQIHSYFCISHITEGETRIQIVNTEKDGKSFQTIKFPAGTEIRIFVSKYPVVEVNKNNGDV
jgi:hypothetical protein